VYAGEGAYREVVWRGELEGELAEFQIQFTLEAFGFPDASYFNHRGVVEFTAD
jgi:hypothetical protein